MRNETQSNNPYVNNLVEMGYDRADCEMVAAAGLDKTFPCVIHGRTFDTQEQYDEELAEYIAGLWQLGNCTQNWVFPLQTLSKLLSYRHEQRNQRHDRKRNLQRLV